MKNGASRHAMYLRQKTGSVCGTWSGTITEAEQRELFGAYVGQEEIQIDGAKELVQPHPAPGATPPFTIFQLDQA